MYFRKLESRPLSSYTLCGSLTQSQSSAVSYLINSYGSLYGASAMGANAFVRYIFAGGFPLFTVQSE